MEELPQEGNEEEASGWYCNTHQHYRLNQVDPKAGGWVHATQLGYAAGGEVTLHNPAVHAKEARKRKAGQQFCSRCQEGWEHLLQRGPQQTAGCSVRTKQFAEGLTKDLAPAIRVVLAPMEWDAVRWCEGAHVPLEPWEEQQHHNTVGRGKKAARIQRFSRTRCQARSMHWRSGGLVTEVKQWESVKWSRDDCMGTRIQIWPWTGDCPMARRY